MFIESAGLGMNVGREVKEDDSENRAVAHGQISVSMHRVDGLPHGFAVVAVGDLDN